MMASYARYGENSPLRNELSEAELKNLTSDVLMSELQNFIDATHVAYYYGTKPAREVGLLLEKYRTAPPKAIPTPTFSVFKEINTESDLVLIVDFPMVQAEVLMLSKGTPHFELSERLIADWYNGYFGSGLSSVVFQEIRESKAFAYSTYAHYSTPSRLHRAHYLQAYVGTQPDKLPDAIPALRAILEVMPVAEEQIETARLSVLRNIETERVSRPKIYWNYLSHKDIGVPNDLRRNIYEATEKMTLTDLLSFQKNKVRGRYYTMLILGSVAQMPMDFLKTIGNVTILELKDISPV